jgi:hypothetical protein
MRKFRSIAILLALPLVAAEGSEKVRIFVTESGAVNASGEAEVGQAKGFLAFDGGVSPLNTEVMRLFLELCSDAVVVTGNREKADYVVRIDSESLSPTTPFVKGNKVAVFDRNEDLVYSNAHRLRKNAVKGTCAALEKRP